MIILWNDLHLLLFISPLHKHISREFYNNDGNVISQDSGLWILPTDYLALEPFADMPILKNVSFAKISGVYGGWPSYVPFKNLIRYVDTCNNNIIGKIYTRALSQSLYCHLMLHSILLYMLQVKIIFRLFYKLFKLLVVFFFQTRSVCLNLAQFFSNYLDQLVSTYNRRQNC